MNVFLRRVPLTLSAFFLVFSVFFLGMIPLTLAEPAAPEAPKGFGISISPSIIRLSGGPGESQSSVIRVWNKSNAAMEFFVDVSDVGNRLNDRGVLERHFLPAGTLPYSCAKWILLKENQFTLPPGEYRDISFLISTPQNAQGGSAAVIFFRGSSAPPQGAQDDKSKPVTSVQIQPRLGVLVFYDIKGTTNRTGTLEEFKVEPPTAEGPLKLRYVFENSGNTDLLVSGNYYILDKNQALVAKENLNSIRTFPGDRGFAETVWQGELSPGDYRLVASFELGPDTAEVIVKQVDFKVA